MYDILILGGGPIGASSAYFLSRKAGKKIAVVTQEPNEAPDAAYLNAGGSVRWFWPDALKSEMTKETADFIKKIAKTGVDLSLHEDTYLFLNRGKHVPAVNISGAKLINHFLDEAKKKKVTIHGGEKIKTVSSEKGVVTVVTDKNTYQAKKVLLALGAQNAAFMPKYKLEKEERYLMILDTPVTETEKTFPHTIVPVAKGVAFVFIKKLPEGWRFVVGQEGILGVPKRTQANTHFKQLLSAGLGDIMPFLKKARVERMLMGTDVENKSLLLKNNGSLYAANCGSAVRSCVWIGRTVAETLSK